MASFDENGKYIKTNWKAGDKITATKLNKIEESIEAVNDNDISRHVETDARLDALEAKDVAHDKEFTNVRNLIADNKAAAELGDYDINSRMTFLENELNEGIEEVHNVAETVDGKINTAVTNVNNVASSVDGKIATAEANMTAQVNQGKADMEAMVAEVEADLDGLHAKTDFVYPEMFGAIGDGATDDTEAFNQMFEASKSIIFIKNADYRVGNLIATPNINAKAPQGINVVISLFKKTDSSVLLGFGNNSKWENINFDCTENDLEWNRGSIENRENITIKGCSFKGFRHDSDRPNAWGIYIKGSKNILIEDCIFENNSQSDIAILEGSSNIVLNRNKGSNFHINLEPNGSYSVENISINDSTLTTLSLLENSYTVHMIDSCMVTNCKIDNIHYRGANVVFTNCKIGNIYSDRAFCGSVISNNSFSTSNNLIKDYKIMNIGLSTDVTEWIVSYSPHSNNLERISTNFGSCLRVNPERKSTAVTIQSKKYKVDSNTIYMFRVKSAAHYKEDSSYISNFGMIVLYHNDGTTTSNGLSVHQSPLNTERSTNPEYNCCFINTGDNITHIEIVLSNGNGSHTTSAVDFYSIELMQVVTEISSNPTYNEDKVYIDTLYGGKINVAGNKNINLIGDTVYLTQPIAGGYLGYVCTASGNPGVWKGFGLIES